MPGSDGSWPLDAITRWRAAKITGSDLAMAQKQATLESTVLANDARRLELARDKGQLIDRADVELWASVALISAREVFMSIPQTLATSAPPEFREHVRAESDQICRAALTTLRRKLDAGELDKELATGEADGDEPNQTEESDKCP